MKEADQIQQIETARLRLRKARPDDLEPIWQNVWQDERLARDMLWQVSATREEAESRLARTIEYQQTYPAFFVCEKATDTPIGFGGVFEKEPGVYAESGLCLAVAYQRQGLGKELLSALVSLVFERLGGRRFLYSCFHHNLRSAALCKAFGFVYATSEQGVRGYDGFAYTVDNYELNLDDYLRAKEQDEGFLLSL